MKIEELIKVRGVDGLIIIEIGQQKIPMSYKQASILAGKLQETVMTEQMCRGSRK